jgi:hypothetical protein
MPQQAWTAVISEPYTADGAAYASSNTLTDVSPTPNTMIPANYLLPGSVLEVRAVGRFSTTGTPTLNLGVYWGGVAGTALCTTGTVTTASGAANVTWDLTATLTVRTIGSAGSVFATGRAHGIASAATVLMPASAPAVTSSLDTTAAKALTVGATWGTNSASNTLTVHQFVITQLL